MKRHWLSWLAMMMGIATSIAGAGPSIAGERRRRPHALDATRLTTVADNPPARSSNTATGFSATRRTRSGRRSPTPRDASPWGADSFNNGAGMRRLLTAAAYAMHNMPLGPAFSAPVRTDEEAYDVAGYRVSQKRPEMVNLDRDFPVRLQKPVDTPYGPHADGFSPEQHRYGPYGPIRAKVRTLAAASGTANAGEPDNGSAPAEATK